MDVQLQNVNPSDSRAFADAQSCRELEDGVSVLRVDPYVAGLFVKALWFVWGVAHIATKPKRSSCVGSFRAARLASGTLCIIPRISPPKPGASTA